MRAKMTCGIKLVITGKLLNPNKDLKFHSF